MNDELITSCHAVGESNYHIQLTPAYRRDVFRNPLVAELIMVYIVEKLRELNVFLLAHDFGPDHLHRGPYEMRDPFSSPLRWRKKYLCRQDLAARQLPRVHLLGDQKLTPLFCQRLANISYARAIALVHYFPHNEEERVF